MERSQDPASWCHYCGGPGETWDHIYPRSKGGIGEWWNLVPCCTPCNQRKANRLPTCTCDKCQDALHFYIGPKKPKKTRADWLAEQETTIEDRLDPDAITELWLLTYNT
jgi:hypothetical protein